ncbi:MAG TPA: hypothetical protein VHS59_05635 [Bacillota bacterium]|nr:hypothetical protein [Bacillota bacterium]
MNGLLAGGLLGAVLSLIVAPQRKRLANKTLMTKTRQAGSRAQKVVREVRQGIMDIKNILD